MGNTPITFVGTEYQSFLQIQRRDFISGRVSMPQQYFIRRHHNRLSDVRKNMISLLYELINLTLCFLAILIILMFMRVICLGIRVCVCTYMYYCTSFIADDNSRSD